MAKKRSTTKKTPKPGAKVSTGAKKGKGSENARPRAGVGRPSSLIDTRVIYCGDCLDQLGELPDRCVDLIYIDPPFNSNRNYEVFWGEKKEKRAFEDRHASKRRIGIGHLPGLEGTRREDAGPCQPYAPVQSWLEAESSGLIDIGATS